MTDVPQGGVVAVLEVIDNDFSLAIPLSPAAFDQRVVKNSRTSLCLALFRALSRLGIENLHVYLWCS